jgi:uncharacterized protein (TIGR02118 family)
MSIKTTTNEVYAMAKAVVLYHAPTDSEAFNSYYTSTHVPLAKKMPGLRSYSISSGPVVTPTGPAPYILIAVLGFDSMEAIQAALASPEGQAVVADLPNFATGGADVLLSDDTEV